MRPSEPLSRLAKRLLLASVFAFGLVSIIATGGGSNGGSDVDDDDFDGAVTLSPASVAVPRGGTVTVRVDVEGLAAGAGVSGYSIDLSEEASRIDISTASCPPGIGTLSCRDWTISPRTDSVPGSYAMRIRAAGIPQSVDSADLKIWVIGSPSGAAPAAVATSRLVVSNDGRLWVTGSNEAGQAGVGFWNACMDLGTDYRCLQPTTISEYVPVGSQTWLDAAAWEDASLGVRSDGTVWAWGSNPSKRLGFSSEGTGEVEIAPRQVPVLENIKRVSIGRTSLSGGWTHPTYLALTGDGLVYAWGGQFSRRCSLQGPCEQTGTHEPRLVPINVDFDGEETPLTNVTQIAGASSNAGFGFALALRQDGSVWEWGSDYFVQQVVGTVFDPFSFFPLAMPARVSGLPLPVGSIAVGSREIDGRDDRFEGFALAVGSDGTVWTWNRTDPTPVQVVGLDDVTAVDADLAGYASALRSDGTQWVWRPGESEPQQLMGLPQIASLGRGSAWHAIAADCPDSGGSLWLSTPSFFSAAPLPHRIADFASPGAGGCTASSQATLTITRTGEGLIATDPLYVDCGSVCEAPVPTHTAVRIRVTPAPGWDLSEPRGGECSHGSMLIMRESKTCSYTFVPEPTPNTLSISASAGGRVLSDPAGIDCPDDCAENYIGTSTSVRLTALTDPGYQSATFGGNEDCADGNVSMSAARHCDVQFIAFPAPATPSGLVATPGAGSVNLAWTPTTDGSVVRYLLEQAEASGAFVTLAELHGTVAAYQDVGARPGTVYTYRLTAINVSGSSPPATVTATLQPSVSVTLTVAVTGPGSVSSSPAGIDCGSDCTQSYPQVAIVTLSATALPSSRFDGWGGACAGTAPIVTITVDANRTCTARFVDVSASGWQTLASDIAASSVRDVRSSVALDQSGRAYIAYLLTVGTQTRLTVRQEGPGFPPLATFNSFDTWSATGAQLVIDPAGDPVIVFNVDSQQIWAARWNGSVFEFLRDGAGSARLNLTATDASTPRIARAGNTLVLAWMEANQIALRRYNLDTRQFDAGAFVPGPTNPFDIDLALDTNGRAVIAWSDGLLGERLQAIRETGSGTWTPLGGDIGVRPLLAPMVMEFGIHVDTNDAIRIAWLEGDTNYHLSLAQFDGAAWTPLPGRPETLYFISGLPVRSLSVNRNTALFAFAYEWDTNQSPSDGLVAVRQLVGGQLTIVGTLESTIHPRVGHLSLAMNEADRATLAQSQFTSVDMTYRLAIRRHVP